MVTNNPVAFRNCKHESNNLAIQGMSWFTHHADTMSAAEAAWHPEVDVVGRVWSGWVHPRRNCSVNSPVGCWGRHCKNTVKTFISFGMLLIFSIVKVKSLVGSAYQKEKVKTTKCIQGLWNRLPWAVCSIQLTCGFNIKETVTYSLQMQISPDAGLTACWNGEKHTLSMYFTTKFQIQH